MSPRTISTIIVVQLNEPHLRPPRSPGAAAQGDDPSRRRRSNLRLQMVLGLTECKTLLIAADEVIARGLCPAALHKSGRDAVDGSSTGTRVPKMWAPIRLPRFGGARACSAPIESERIPVGSRMSESIGIDSIWGSGCDAEGLFCGHA